MGRLNKTNNHERMFGNNNPRVFEQTAEPWRMNEVVQDKEKYEKNAQNKLSKQYLLSSPFATNEPKTKPVKRNLKGHPEWINEQVQGNIKPATRFGKTTHKETKHLTQGNTTNTFLTTAQQSFSNQYKTQVELDREKRMRRDQVVIEKTRQVREKIEESAMERNKKSWNQNEGRIKALTKQREAYHHQLGKDYLNQPMIDDRYD